MHEELDAYSLAGVWCHVHRLLDPRLSVKALMEDCLQDVAVSISNIGVLPVERDFVGCTIPVPEAQCAANRRQRELLIE
jgi:hypothetical protein